MLPTSESSKPMFSSNCTTLDAELELELELELEKLEELSEDDSELETEEEEETEDKDELEDFDPEPPPQAVSANTIANKLKRIKLDIWELLSIIVNVTSTPKVL